MTVRTPDAFEAKLSEFIYEVSEEMRAVLVGLKETSEEALIYERYADLYTRDQAAALREAEVRAADDEERERLSRLRRTCEDALIEAALVARRDALQNAELATTIEFKGETMPLRAAEAKIALLHGYCDRDELGDLYVDALVTFNGRRLKLLQDNESLAAEFSKEPDPVRRSESDKGISLRQLADVVRAASNALGPSYTALRQKWFDRLLGLAREEHPKSYHAAYMRRLSPLEAIYTKERGVEVCLATLNAMGFNLAAMPNIRLDVEDRPQKRPRAFCMPSNPPAVVHLVTRVQGGLKDYQSFLHEAGHALHYGGCNPALPYAFRFISRDNALTEIYSFISEAAVREPEWHARYFGLSDAEASENAEVATFIYGLLFRRYAAKLEFELDFWSRFANDGGTSWGYAEKLFEATGLVYRSDAFLADMDSGFYSADYLRAWIRSAQLRERLIGDIGEDWWRRSETGDFLKQLFWEGTKPSSEEIARRIGFDPLDTKPLETELTRFRR